jgi:hypothetical protein
MPEPQLPEDPTLIELKVHGDGTLPPYYVKVKKGDGAFDILWLAVQVALQRMRDLGKDV